MNLRMAHRWPTILLVVAFSLIFGPLFGNDSEAWAGLGTRARDPMTVIPLEQVPTEHRGSVVETIRDATFHRQGEPDAFPCNSKLYLNLLNEPAITLALWKDLSESPVRLRQVGSSLYQGSDGAGASASWEYLIRTPNLTVLLSHLDYSGPRGNVNLQGRIVLIVRSGFYREVNGESYVKHDIEAFVKIDTKGWKAVAKTVRPIIEKLLEDQVREAGWFVSLMGRLVETYPDWAKQVALTKAEAVAETKQRFAKVVEESRRPNASSGRPTLLADSAASSSTPKRR